MKFNCLFILAMLCAFNSSAQIDHTLSFKFGRSIPLETFRHFRPDIYGETLEGSIIEVFYQLEVSSRVSWVVDLFVTSNSINQFNVGSALQVEYPDEQLLFVRAGNWRSSSLLSGLEFKQAPSNSRWEFRLKALLGISWVSSPNTNAQFNRLGNLNRLIDRSSGSGSGIGFLNGVGATYSFNQKIKLVLDLDHYYSNTRISGVRLNHFDGNNSFIDQLPSYQSNINLLTAKVGLRCALK